MSEITIMMVTYNRLNLTKRTFEGLKKSLKSPVNMVIIDNNSTDGTVEFLRELQPFGLVEKIVTVFNGDNKGIAIGRNQGLKSALELGTKWFVTLDNDVEMPRGWLDESICILCANRGYGAIGVNMENKPYPFVMKNGYTFQDKPAGNLGTACMVFPKSTQQMLGFFNTEYGVYGEEDADYGMRMRVAGFRLGYIKEMGTHFGEGELDKGEYREFKTKAHQDNLKKFNENCAAYAQRRKPLHIPFKD